MAELGGQSPDAQGWLEDSDGGVSGSRFKGQGNASWTGFRYVPLQAKKSEPHLAFALSGSHRTQGAELHGH